MYEEMKLDELKRELRKRKLKVSGRKQDLIARLRNSDANAINRNDDQGQMDMEYNMTLPEGHRYKDLNSRRLDDKFPKITVNRVLDYLSQFHKQIDDKCKALYHESTEVSPMATLWWMKKKVQPFMPNTNHVGPWHSL